VDEAAEATAALPEKARQVMLSRTLNDTRDADMAALVASVAEPGLQQRIVAFLEGK